MSGGYILGGMLTFKNEGENNIYIFRNILFLDPELCQELFPVNSPNQRLSTDVSIIFICQTDPEILKCMQDLCPTLLVNYICLTLCNTITACRGFSFNLTLYFSLNSFELPILKKLKSYFLKIGFNFLANS